MTFKGELRSRRWLIDKWYGPSVWLGMCYDAFSDCGRSIWRPFVTWAALVLGFAAFYFSRAVDGLAARCGGNARLAGALPLHQERARGVRRHARRARQSSLSLPVWQPWQCR